jgi:hypothetical protein
MSDLGRKLRAARRRKTAILNRASLKVTEQDLTPISGVAAISLVRQLAQECWALGGQQAPEYSRDEIPIKFLPNRPT